MEFKVIEKPDVADLAESATVVTALVENLGKAISIPLGEQSSNNVRKKVRAAFARRNGFSQKYLFKTRVMKDELVVWLEEKPAK